MKRTMVLNVVGLTRELLQRGEMPRLASMLPASVPVGGVTPAVTCPVQSTYLTGRLPRDHGIVANGWYFRELDQVWLWRQSNRLVQGPKIWHLGRARDPGFTCANLFWWYNMATDADWSVTPRPIYTADGRKIPDCATNPPELRAGLTRSLGRFPLFSFWGPASSITSSEWIAAAAMSVEERHGPALSLVYLPHLDYVLQQRGPQGDVAAQLRAIDALCGRLLDFCFERSLRVVVLSEYGITAVRDVVHPNRLLRRAGLLEVKVDLGREYLDTGRSRAFAVADPGRRAPRRGRQAAWPAGAAEAGQPADRLDQRARRYAARGRECRSRDLAARRRVPLLLLPRRDGAQRPLGQGLGSPAPASATHPGRPGRRGRGGRAGHGAAARRAGPAPRRAGAGKPAGRADPARLHPGLRSLAQGEPAGSPADGALPRAELPRGRAGRCGGRGDRGPAAGRAAADRLRAAADAGRPRPGERPREVAPAAARPLAAGRRERARRARPGRGAGGASLAAAGHRRGRAHRGRTALGAGGLKSCSPRTHHEPALGHEHDEQGPDLAGDQPQSTCALRRPGRAVRAPSDPETEKVGALGLTLDVLRDERFFDVDRRAVRISPEERYAARVELIPCV